MMVEKPYYSSIKIIVLMPLLVFFLDMAYKYIFGEETYNVYKIDNISHLFGGISVFISTAGVLWNLVHRNKIILQDVIWDLEDIIEIYLPNRIKSFSNSYKRINFDEINEHLAISDFPRDCN